MSPDQSHKKYLARYEWIDHFAFLPLAIFLLTVQFHTAPFPERWAYAYFYTFAPALVCTIVGLSVWKRQSLMWLGTNAWFVALGVLTLLRAWDTLNLLGNAFKESGGFIMAAVLAVGATLRFPGGLLRDCHAPTAASRACSWVLAGVCIAGAVVSYLMQGHRLWSISIPVLSFFLASLYLQRHLQSNPPASES